MIFSILAVLGLLAAVTPSIFRAIIFPHDYVEKDEWAVADWQDMHKALEAWREE